MQNVVVKSKSIHQINSLPDSYASDKVECLHLLQWLSDQQITYKIYLILSNSFSYNQSFGYEKKLFLYYLKNWMLYPLHTDL